MLVLTGKGNQFDKFDRQFRLISKLELEASESQMQSTLHARESSQLQFTNLP